MSGSQKTIAVVTGAGGYVATHIIKKLVERGTYEIRGTVRSIAKSEELQKAFPSLKLYEADLLANGSFDQVVQGADVVFHAASPFHYKFTDPQKEMVEPALQGTLNLLRAVDKAPTVKCVVLTSSNAAIQYPAPDEYVFSEKDWNNWANLENDAYSLSKKLAEEAAWNFAKGKHFKLLVANPAFVLGPVLTKRADGTSIEAMTAVLNGGFLEKGVPPLAYGVVDVRDLAELQVRLAENPDAEGRHLICSSRGIPYLEYVDALRKSGKFTKYELPTKVNGTVTMNPRYDTSKVQTQLGMKFIPTEQTMVDMAESLIEFGLVPKKA